MKHEWQSSYAMDCRSMDPGANPGSCSTIYPITAFSVNKRPMTNAVTITMTLKSYA